MEIHTETCDLDEDCTCPVSHYAEWSGPRSVPGVTQSFWVGVASALVIGGLWFFVMALLISALL